MKQITRLTLLLLLALAPACNHRPTDSWYAYKPEDGSYTIKFPEKPSEKTQSAPTPIGTIYFVQASYFAPNGKRDLFSSSTRYRIDPQRYNVEKGLDGARDAAARSANATIVSEKKIDYKGAPGREIEMAVPGGARVRERMYIVNAGTGPIIYQALVVDADGNVSDMQADGFLSTLQFEPK